MIKKEEELQQLKQEFEGIKNLEEKDFINWVADSRNRIKALRIKHLEQQLKNISELKKILLDGTAIDKTA